MEKIKFLALAVLMMFGVMSNMAFAQPAPEPETHTFTYSIPEPTTKVNGGALDNLKEMELHAEVNNDGRGAYVLKVPASSLTGGDILAGKMTVPLNVKEGTDPIRIVFTARAVNTSGVKSEFGEPVIKLGPFEELPDPGEAPSPPGSLMITRVFCKDCEVNVSCIEPCTVDVDGK